MKNKILAMFDYLLILVVLILVALGVLFIYSSSINSEGVSVTNEYIKQIIWASIGFVIMIFVTLYDYRKTESFTQYLYIFAAELCTLFLLFYNYGNKKYKNVLLFFMILFTLFSGIFVNPIVKEKETIVTAPIVEVYEN